MRYIKQGFWVLVFSVAGETARYLIPLPIPASIYGLALLALALKTGLLPASAIEDAGDFLIRLMPLLFVPAGVGLVASWSLLRDSALAVCVIVVASTALVFAVSGKTAQLMLRRRGAKRHE